MGVKGLKGMLMEGGMDELKMKVGIGGEIVVQSHACTAQQKIISHAQGV